MSNMSKLSPDCSFSVQEIIDMSALLLQKYGTEAETIAQLLADQHLQHNDQSRAAAWQNVKNHLSGQVVAQP